MYDTDVDVEIDEDKNSGGEVYMTSLGNKEVFARNFNHYIEKSGKTQKEIAEKLDVATSTLNNWATAKKYPRIDKIEALANYFGIKKSDLIENKFERAVDEDPEGTAYRHFEMITDEDLNDIFDDFQYLDILERKMVKDLAHSLAERKKTEA